MSAAPRDFTNLEVQRALGGQPFWPDPIRYPLQFAALWRFCQIRLAEMFGHDQTLDASLVGAYACPVTRGHMDQGSALHSAWAAAQQVKGKPSTDEALKIAARSEARL